MRQTGNMSREKAEASLRSFEAATRDPTKRRLMECMGVPVWNVPPAGWAAPTSSECRTVTSQLGVPYVYEPLR